MTRSTPILCLSFIFRAWAETQFNPITLMQAWTEAFKPYF